jgi:solute carrier family 25 carnitine/acylcarnitine transporter 20/29
MGFKAYIKVTARNIQLLGFSGTLLFRSFFWVLWGGYEVCMDGTLLTQVYNRKLSEWGMKQSMVPFFAGGLAANTFWTISFPADVLKNRLAVLM